MRDPYLYKDCDVLRNKLGIKDEAVLKIAETDITCAAIHDISLYPIAGNYDFEHLCKIHFDVFQEIYDWAGKPRTVQIQKAEAVLGGMSIDYSAPNKIEGEVNSILDKMRTINWNGLSLAEQAERLSNGLSDLWRVHPFREGNTRTIVTFVCQFSDSVGMTIDRALFERNAVYTRNALVAASALFPDCDLRKPDYLLRIVKDSLERGRAEAENDKK